MYKLLLLVPILLFLFLNGCTQQLQGPSPQTPISSYSLESLDARYQHIQRLP